MASHKAVIDIKINTNAMTLLIVAYHIMFHFLFFTHIMKMMMMMVYSVMILKMIMGCCLDVMILNMIKRKRQRQIQS